MLCNTYICIAKYIPHISTSFLPTLTLVRYDGGHQRHGSQLSALQWPGGGFQVN